MNDEKAFIAIGFFVLGFIVGYFGEIMISIFRDDKENK